MTSVRFRMTSRKRHSVILLIVGLIWGHLTFLFITSLLPRGQHFPCTLPSFTQMGEGITRLEITQNSLQVSPRQLLFVGVMTSRKLLRTRALAIFKTWGAALNGSLVFFVGREDDDIVTKSHDVVGRGGDVVRKGDDVVTRVGDVVIRDDMLGRGDDAVTIGDDVVGGGDGMLRGDVTGREDDVVEEDTLPVQILENVEDSEYPPQKKSFAMLEFMHREHGGRYHWFMRADDDLFVDVRRMRMLLSSLNSSLPLYVGHPGTGRPEEAGRLGLPEGVPYCMGGTGVVLSSALLTSLADSLVMCAQNTVTCHEDSELGRCIYNVSSLACLQSRKINRRFKQSYDDTSGQWIRKAMQSSQPYVTFHPVKDTRYVYDSAALVQGLAMAGLGIMIKFQTGEWLRYEVQKDPVGRLYAPFFKPDKASTTAPLQLLSQNIASTILYLGLAVILISDLGLAGALYLRTLLVLLDCCGVNGPEDFAALYCDKFVPETCCRRELVENVKQQKVLRCKNRSKYLREG
ncbi:hypothetical protein ACOMHN_035567 [Nucella lapillus]